MPQAREPRQILAGRRIALVAKLFDRGDGRLLKQRAALRAAGAEVGCFAMIDHARSAPDVTTPDWRAARTRTAMTGGIVLAAGVFGARLAAGRATRDAIGDASSWLAYRGQVRALADVLAAWRPDVVVCSDPETLPAVVRFKALGGGAVLYDAHEFHEEEDHTDSGRQAWVQKVETRAAGAIDGFVTVNAGIAALYAERRPGLPPAVIVHNAGELETPPAYDGRLHRAAGLPASTRILLFQGGLAPMRGLEALVDAGARLPEGWALVLMGSGRLEPSLRARADADRVRFVAPAPFAELPQWTVGAALGALLYEDLNLNQRHCSPNKLWEYPAAGVPMLATDLPEIQRLASPYGVAFFVPSGAGATDIAARVASLTDADLAEARVGAAAFTRLHSWRANAEAFVSEVARLAADR
ncbi:glycosyltransferase [Caulobacter sp. Root487D2Y]|uniref:glycosyltransferase n=1 Tax=Caulobacter sp. Root487D2Y TaxID=1736547 RepID=UPI0009EB61A3|nr:glycosyltransferase [Caulobacter sp. Root487D2Y]